MKPLAQEIANKLQAIENCKKSGNQDWLDKHTEEVLKIVKRDLPHGGGFDSGTQIDLDESTPEMLVFRTSYHHMNEDGMYTHWTDHTVKVRPSLVFGIVLETTCDGGAEGDDEEVADDFDDYLHEVFHYVLTVPED